MTTSPIRPHNAADAEPAATRCPSATTAIDVSEAPGFAAQGDVVPFVDCLSIGPGVELSPAGAAGGMR